MAERKRQVDRFRRIRQRLIYTALGNYVRGLIVVCGAMAVYQFGTLWAAAKVPAAEGAGVPYT